MSVLPGLGLTAPQAQAASEPQTRNVTLKPGTEWRFEVPSDSSITVKLLSTPTDSKHANGVEAGLKNTAEVFGTELAPNHSYEFSPLTKAAIFTHHGCTISVTGNCESEYVAEETPMNAYLNLHFALENLRTNAEGDETGGPRVLVLGPENTGKTSLIKLLTAYAVKVGRTPLVVNLDPHEGMLALPGSVSSAAFGTGAVLDVEDASSNGWGSSPIGGPTALPVELPLVYHVGIAGPEQRPEVFKPVTTRLALAATSRFEDQRDIKDAGILVDIAGSACSGKKSTDIINHVVSEFSINVILVMGSERLHSEMTRQFAATNGNNSYAEEERIHVLKIPRSEGCVDRENSYMKQFQQMQIRNYFFGSLKSTLSPHTISADFASLHIFKMVDPTSDNLDFLPGGANDDDDEQMNKRSQIFERVKPSLAMNSAVLAVKHASPNDRQETIRDATVKGYLYVADVDEAKSRVRILSPIGGRLPQNALIWGLWDGADGIGDLLG